MQSTSTETIKREYLCSDVLRINSDTERVSDIFVRIKKLENMRDVSSPPAHAYVDRACRPSAAHTWHDLHVIRTSLSRPARGGRVMTVAKGTVKSATAHPYIYSGVAGRGSPGVRTPLSCPVGSMQNVKIR